LISPLINLILFNLLAGIVGGKSGSHVISGSQKGEFRMLRFMSSILVIFRNVDVEILGRTGWSLGVENLLDSLLA
jgi:hypothetical protein